MFSTYEQLSREQFYPISRLESGALMPEQTLHEKATASGGVINSLVDGIRTSLKGKDGQLATGKLLLLVITVLLFIEDSENESDLLIVTAAAFLLGL